MQADIGYRRYHLKIANHAVPTAYKNQRFLTQRNQGFLIRKSTANDACVGVSIVHGQLTFRPLGVPEQISILLYHDIYCISEVIIIPSISIYVNDELYQYLFDKGPSPSKAGKDIIESEYNRQKETENATQ